MVIILYSQEKDERDAELSQMKSEHESLKREKLALEESLSQLSAQSEDQRKKGEGQEAELTKLQSETKGLKEEIGEKNKMIQKVQSIPSLLFYFLFSVRLKNSVVSIAQCLRSLRRSLKTAKPKEQNLSLKLKN